MGLVVPTPCNRVHGEMGGAAHGQLRGVVLNGRPGSPRLSRGGQVAGGWSGGCLVDGLGWCGQGGVPAHAAGDDHVQLPQERGGQAARACPGFSGLPGRVVRWCRRAA
jgi:hypothetical protein